MTITLFILFVPVLVLILLILNVLFSIHKPDIEKNTTYECGFNPIQGQARAPFFVRHFIISILFLIFDLEIAFFYPIAVSLFQIIDYGYWITIIFLLLLTVGFIYEFGKGALYFVHQK